MLAAFRGNGCKGFTVAWDKQPGDQKKAYGLYSSVEDFFKNMLRNTADARFGYELIPENTECKAYADIEWYGEQDSAHAILKGFVAFLRERAGEWYPQMGERPRIYVACGSRPDKEWFKNSYHLTIDNLVFTCNHDGQMKSFFTPPPDTCDPSHDHSKFYRTNPRGERKCIVDLSVYSKNRTFRLPYNMKRGTTVPLLRLSKDPFDDDFTGEYKDEKMDDVLPLVITANIERCADTCFVPSAADSTDSVQPARGKRKRQESVDPDGGGAALQCPANIDIPIPMKALRAALEEHGDQVSQPCPSKPISTGEKGWCIQCNQHGNPRQCLIDPTKTHTSNNVMLFLLPNPKSPMQLKYQCLSERCRHEPRKLLGCYQLNEWCQWEFVKHQPVQQIPGEVQAQVMETGVKPETDAVVDIFDPADTQVYSYEITKKSFECRCFRIADPYAYGVLPRDIGITAIPQQMTHQTFKNYFATVHYSDQDKYGNIVKRRFIEDWLSDKTLREVTKLVVDPRNSDPNAYNMWKPYTASHLQAVPDAQVEDMVAPIILHIRDVIANGNEAHTGWFLDWVANMVQRPHQKSNVAILLYGKQGCGKGILIDFMRVSVLGSHCTYQTSNPERDILGRFSSGMVGKVLVQLDEVKALHGHSDVLKDLITGNTFEYEPKYGKNITIQNYANMVFTTNNENALSVPVDDRRHVLFRCSDKHKGDEVYFNTLLAHLQKPDTARAVYQYLLGRDLSAYPTDFQSSRPKTDYFMEAQKSSLTPMKLFMSAIVHSDKEGDFDSAKIYQLYCAFHRENGYKKDFLHTQNGFSRDLKRFGGITPIPKGNQGVRVNINRKLLKEYLEREHEYDHEASLPLLSFER